MASTGTSRGGGTRFVLAAIVGLVGLVFIGQGLGFVAGSFMTGDLFWAVVGIVLVVAALSYAEWPRLCRR
ncbi:MAG TPA: hypothetical protein VFP56_10725 [Candidatus Limnocylindrales bacterium]|nr:hypothetical protein [Candidatus Limnocylindrales bacterium]